MGVKVGRGRAVRVGRWGPRSCPGGARLVVRRGVLGGFVLPEVHSEEPPLAPVPGNPRREQPPLTVLRAPRAPAAVRPAPPFTRREEREGGWGKRRNVQARCTRSLWATVGKPSLLKP